MKKKLLILVILNVLLITYTIQTQPLQLVNAFPNLSFTQSLYLTHSNDGTNRIYVVQQNGFIKVFPNDSTVSSGSVVDFLNLTNKILTGSERGLLGLAFHPNYSVNRYFWVNYTRQPDGATVISRFTRSAGNPNKADSLSEVVYKVIPQPFSNHNGGIIFFGTDGNLYIGMGDGGSSNDPGHRAQNPNELLGKILRINVDSASGGNQYSIPPTNPYATGGGAPEIFCIGMRNPWRMSQDPVTSEIWCGDVGQVAREEIDLIEVGKNYGWRCMEGFIASTVYNNGGCDSVNNVYTRPKKDYGRSLGFSVTGGYIYRGSRRPDLTGRYIYADYGSGRIWKLLYQGGAVVEDQELMDSPYNIASFGVDQNNELYILALSGSIYRFNKITTSIGNELGTVYGYALKQNYPNPFNPVTNISYSLPKLSFVQLDIYDVSGRFVKRLVNNTQVEGNYTVQWNGKDDAGNTAASGVYFYTINAGEFRDNKKMLLVK